ncbi:hypothetical protein ABT025_12115 [Streptomyces sp. NPDC002809]
MSGSRPCLPDKTADGSRAGGQRSAGRWTRGRQYDSHRVVGDRPPELG